MTRIESPDSPVPSSSGTSDGPSPSERPSASPFFSGGQGRLASHYTSFNLTADTTSQAIEALHRAADLIADLATMDGMTVEVRGDVEVYAHWSLDEADKDDIP